MRRREFVGLPSGVASSIALPLAVRAQQPMPVVGFLSSRTAQQAEYLLPAFRMGLKESGYVEGQNVEIEFRFADNRYDRLLPPNWWPVRSR